jgi:hypothetical protein
MGFREDQLGAFAASWPRAASGHAAVLPSSVMNERRLTSNMRLPSPRSAGRDHDHQQMKAGAAGLRPLSLPRGAAKSLASCRNDLNHPESF